MPYPCTLFYADVKFDIRFDVKLWNSFHVIYTINFGNRFDIRIKQTTWIGHETHSGYLYYIDGYKK